MRTSWPGVLPSPKTTSGRPRRRRRCVSRRAPPTSVKGSRRSSSMSAWGARPPSRPRRIQRRSVRSSIIIEDYTDFKIGFHGYDPNLICVICSSNPRNPTCIDHDSAGSDEVDDQERQEGGRHKIKIVEVDELSRLAPPALAPDRRGGRGPEPHRPLQFLDLVWPEAEELSAQLVARQLSLPAKLLHLHFSNAEKHRNFTGRPQLFHVRLSPCCPLGPLGPLSPLTQR